MANIEITSSINTVTIVSNDYLKAIGSPCITLNKSDLNKIYISKESNYVTVEVKGTKDFNVDMVGFLEGSTNKTIKIDSINGITPTDIQHIHDLFVTLKN